MTCKMRVLSAACVWVLVVICGERAVGLKLLEDVVNCTRENPTSPAVVDISGFFDYVLFNITHEFEFIQVSMEITPCPREEEIIGIHNLTHETFDGLPSPHLVLMALEYAKEEEGHGYKLTMNKLNFTEHIATTETCGEFMGYHVKAVGASACVLWELASPPTMHSSKKRTNAKGHITLSRLDELHRRATAAYVVVLCFTLTTFFVLQLVKKCSGRRGQVDSQRYRIVSKYFKVLFFLWFMIKKSFKYHNPCHKGIVSCLIKPFFWFMIQKKNPFTYHSQYLLCLLEIF